MSTQPPNQEEGLSPMALRALREADDLVIVARRNRTDATVQETAHMRASKRVENRGPFDDHERTYVIDGLRANFVTYGRPIPDAVTATGHVGSCRVQEEWRTIAKLLRPGDVLTIRVSVYGGNEYAKNAGLHHDEMYLDVYRKGKKHYAFHLADTLAPANMARMVRPTPT